MIIGKAFFKVKYSRNTYFPPKKNQKKWIILNVINRLLDQTPNRRLKIRSDEINTSKVIDSLCNAIKVSLIFGVLHLEVQCRRYQHLKVQCRDLGMWQTMHLLFYCSIPAGCRCSPCPQSGDKNAQCACGAVHGAVQFLGQSSRGKDTIVTTVGKGNLVNICCPNTPVRTGSARLPSLVGEVWRRAHAGWFWRRKLCWWRGRSSRSISQTLPGKRTNHSN